MLNKKNEEEKNKSNESERIFFKFSARWYHLAMLATEEPGEKSSPLASIVSVYTLVKK